MKFFGGENINHCGLLILFAVVVAFYFPVKPTFILALTTLHRSSSSPPIQFSIQVVQSVGESLQSAGMMSVAGDILDTGGPLLPAADVYTLIRVLHDWDDDYAVRSFLAAAAGQAKSQAAGR
jgi:hypothetical protein